MSVSDSSPAPHRALQSSLLLLSSGDNRFFSKILLSWFAGRIAGCSDVYSSVQIVLYSSLVRGRQESYIVSQVSLSDACSFSASNKWLLVGPARVSPGKGSPSAERETRGKAALNLWMGAQQCRLGGMASGCRPRALSLIACFRGVRLCCCVITRVHPHVSSLSAPLICVILVLKST